MAIIDKPSDYFNTKLYTGNGGTQSITGVGFQPDFLWFKNRDETQWHQIYDVIRGIGSTSYYLSSNTTNAEASTTNSLTGVSSDGFSLGNNTGVNGSADNIVAWNWKEQAGVFDIVSFTGNGSARTISHNLGVVPKMYIVKNLSTGSTQWRVYHASLGATKFMCLDATQAVGTASSVFNNTEPTSSVFSVGTDTAANENGDNLICYLFADSSMSKMGSYTGNGNADGPFVYTGFKPAFVIQKRTDATSNWHLIDNKRNTFNPEDKLLFANGSGAEATEGNFDFLSNGMKIRYVHGGWLNASGGNYIYMAFAENPFVASNFVPATAR